MLINFIKVFFFVILLNSSSVRAIEKNQNTQNNFQIAKVGYKYVFPKDHQPHHQFASEWWYYTGILHVSKQRSFGYQLTFFRVGTKPNDGQSEAIYIAHFALSDLKSKKFYYFDRLNRPILKMANAFPEKNGVFLWNKNWSARIQNNEHILEAEAENIKINLKLYSNQKPIIHGKPNENISRKGDCPSCASHYYSLTNLQSTGQIQIDDEVFNVQGISWMDHEFGSSQLQAHQEGWDWFSLYFDDGSSLMLYQIREKNGKISPYSQGTYVSSDGKSQYLGQKEILMHPVKNWLSPHTKTFYPLIWEITIPKLNLGIKTLPLSLDQELRTNNSTRISYWEGAIKAVDRVSGKKIAEGYLELTGYAESLKGKF